jgi:hypothetical protein
MPKWLILFLIFLAGCVQQQPVACTEDAKLCPDGSAVGRILPNCDFAPCPEHGKDFCQVDADCVCDGIDPVSGDCFVGSKTYHESFVNKEQDCPDFCTGIDGRLRTQCVENKCSLVRVSEPPEVGPWIEVIPEPASGEIPLLVHFTAILRGAERADERFYCVEMNWQFGDGEGQAAMPSCVPLTPDFEIHTRYEAQHRYEKPGNYEATFTLGGLKSKPAFVTTAGELFPPECDEDADCVPAQCCHPADCVIREKRPYCNNVFCTKECRPGTLDCGGRCECINYRCTGTGFLPGTDTTEPRPWQELP